MKGRGRNWCYTLNNYTEDDITNLLNLFDTRDDVGYHIFGEEIGEEGTPHLQGYIRFTKALRFANVKTILGDRAHIEQRRGTDKQAADYCKKDGKYHEFGMINTTVNQWKRIRELEAEGDYFTIAEEFPAAYHRYHHAILDECTQRDDLPEYPGDLKDKNFWYYGPPRTGKSTRARSLARPVYLKNPNKWWNGYRRQPIVLLEDLDPECTKYLIQHLKIWADRFPFSAEVKGGHISISPNDYKLVVTSNYSMEECFHGIDLEALKARFSVCHFDKFP